MQDEIIPRGYCQCGCGEKTTVATKTQASEGRIAGQPVRFVRGHQQRHLSSVPYLRVRLAARTDESPGQGPRGDCREWNGQRDADGYGVTKVRGRNRRATHLAWFLATGEWPGTLQVLHHCDNPPCVNTAHLYLGTDADNKRDVVERRRLAGERSPKARLTLAEVNWIRDLRGVEPQRALARRFGVSPATIAGIHSGKNWG